MRATAIRFVVARPRARAVIGRAWLRLTAPIVSLMAAVSAAGVVDDRVYARESASWAAQGVGQDVVNLLVAGPALAITAYLAARGSVRAWLVWMGLLIYVIYSYVLYAFFVHFNALFLAYIAILGLSAYALGGALATVERDGLARCFDCQRTHTAVRTYLMITGVGFAALWLADIIRATVSGTAPANLIETRLPVNPIHVLDLAFVLPAMIMTSVLLRKRNLAGLLLAVPLMTFGAVMGLALIAMSRVMTARGIRGLGALELVMAVMVSVSVFLTYSFLKDTADAVN